MLEKIRNLRAISWLETEYRFDALDEIDLRKPVYGFYHIYCVNDWERIVREQVHRIGESGLYEKTTKIFVGCIAFSLADTEKLKTLLPPKYQLDYLSLGSTGYEMKTLDLLWKKAQNEDFYLYYFHTKGVSMDGHSCALHQKKYPFFKMREKSMKECSEKWRLLMEYFIFDRYTCDIHALNKGFNLYGVIPRYEGGIPYFSGNFWWADSEYIRELPDIDASGENRYTAEFWVGLNKKWHPYVPYHSLINMYYSPVPEVFYMDRSWGVRDLYSVLRCYYLHFKLILCDLCRKKIHL